jgi:hypothetical protein
MFFLEEQSTHLLFFIAYKYNMSIREIENYEQLEKSANIVDSPPPPAEPIYDLTTSNRTELVKAAGPFERGENP